MRFLLATILLSPFVQAQKISGKVTSSDKVVQYAVIQVGHLGAVSDSLGYYIIDGVKPGSYELTVRAFGYQNFNQKIDIQGDTAIYVNLLELSYELSQVVITGTRTLKTVSESAIGVGIIDAKTLTGVQACALSDGLKFQPGLRVETDCQTCNYTQLRMNGLAGGYSQILINGRPIFGPLMGLYGMEQIPVNMIERIEVVRGGGSALYGSSAIGGIVNIITKLPKNSGFEASKTYQSIYGKCNDYILSGNATVVSSQENSGAAFFFNRRHRGFFDANGDNFSEIPKLSSLAMGANMFFLPSENQKIELNLASINEYRNGGEMTDAQPHFAQQAEERRHDIWLGNLDYQINIGEHASFITYIAAQATHRNHYTGVLPDDSLKQIHHLRMPPYGKSDNSIYQIGFQFNFKPEVFFSRRNTFTIGSEYICDAIKDQIPAYRYWIAQSTRNIGCFLQSDWEIIPRLTLLSGFRLDWHNLVKGVVANPRLAVLFKQNQTTQYRLSWGKGFRAPQAFDSDLHVAFAGGGVSRASLDPMLKPENSQSLSSSVSYDKSLESVVYGFTIEGFYTRLNNAFYLRNIGNDEFGELLVKSNGVGAVVYGLTLETRINIRKRYQFESGFTIQSSYYTKPIQIIEGLEAQKSFLRTPCRYGYANFWWNPNQYWSISTNLVYTGSMLLAHFAGAPQQPNDAYKISKPFTEFGLRVSYRVDMSSVDAKFEFFGGVKNITNAFQRDFDTGKYRDSNYVHGPSLPRTFFIGLKIASL